MSESNSIAIGDGLKELLYHLSHIADQESVLRQMMSDLASASDIEQRAAVLSRIDIEVIYHLGYHLKELRKPLAEELNRAYRTLGDTEDGGHSDEEMDP